MESLLPELAKFGFGGIMVAIVIWLLWQQNKKADDRSDILAAKLDKQSEWQIEFIENNTKATMGAAQAQVALTATLQALVDSVKDLDRTMRDRVK